MNKLEVAELRAAGFAQDWKYLGFCIRDSMRKRGIKSIPITGYTAEEKEKRAALGQIQDICHGR